MKADDKQAKPACMLRFTVCCSELDFNGDVVSRETERMVPWENYDAKEILGGVIVSGGLSGVSLPTSDSTFEDFYLNRISPSRRDFNSESRVDKVCSEEVCGMRFVAFDRSSTVTMKWVKA